MTMYTCSEVQNRRDDRPIEIPRQLQKVGRSDPMLKFTIEPGIPFYHWPGISGAINDLILMENFRYPSIFWKTSMAINTLSSKSLAPFKELISSTLLERQLVGE